MPSSSHKSKKTNEEDKKRVSIKRLFDSNKNIIDKINKKKRKNLRKNNKSTNDSLPSEKLNNNNNNNTKQKPTRVVKQSIEQTRRDKIKFYQNSKVLPTSVKTLRGKLEQFYDIFEREGYLPNNVFTSTINPTKKLDEKDGMIFFW